MTAPSTPVRIQRRRVKGWVMPPGAIYVGRPSRWANPFPTSGAWITWAAVAAGFRGDKAGRLAASLFFYRRWLGLDEPTDAQGHGRIHGCADAQGHRATGGIQVAAGAFLMDTGLTLSADLQDCEWTRALAAGVATMYAGEIRPWVPPTMAGIRETLRGHDLACWCALDQPCHADVLLEIANQRVGING